MPTLTEAINTVGGEIATDTSDSNLDLPVTITTAKLVTLSSIPKHNADTQDLPSLTITPHTPTDQTLPIFPAVYSSSPPPLSPQELKKCDYVGQQPQEQSDYKNQSISSKDMGGQDENYDNKNYNKNDNDNDNNPSMQAYSNALVSPKPKKPLQIFTKDIILSLEQQKNPIFVNNDINNIQLPTSPPTSPHSQQQQQQQQYDYFSASPLQFDEDSQNTLYNNQANQQFKQENKIKKRPPFPKPRSYTDQSQVFYEPLSPDQISPVSDSSFDNLPSPPLNHPYYQQADQNNLTVRGRPLSNSQSAPSLILPDGMPENRDVSEQDYGSATVFARRSNDNLLQSSSERATWGYASAQRRTLQHNQSQINIRTSWAPLSLTASDPNRLSWNPQDRKLASSSNVKLLIDDKRAKRATMMSFTLTSDDNAMKAYRESTIKTNNIGVQLDYAKLLLNMCHQYEKPSEVNEEHIDAQRMETYEKLVEESVYWIEKLVKANCSEAQYIKGTWYADGTFGKEKNPAKAFKYYMTASKGNFHKADYQVACYYERAKNYSRALQFYQKSAARTNVNANYVSIFFNSTETLNVIYNDVFIVC